MREKLADQLRVLYPEATEDVFGVLADECLRQMEWARRQVPMGMSPRQVDLAIAPPDWKP